MSSGATLERLSELVGLITSYRDAWGNTRRMTQGTQRALLAAMGIDAENSDAVAASVRDLEDAPWRRPLDLVLVAPHARRAGLRVPLTLPAAADGRRIGWRFEKEMGEARDGNVRFGELPLLEGRKLDGEAFERRALEIAIPTGPGYHRLRVFGSGAGGLGDDSEGISLPVIVVPNHVPRRRRDQGRARGIGIQLYGLRSARNWGIGDFTDLARFLGLAARLGADAVGLNPLHALFPGNPERISPYSPSDRRFLSTLYIDVEAIADFAECEPAKDGAAQRAGGKPDRRRKRRRDLLGSAEVRLRLDAARKAALVDYSEVAALKRHALELVFCSFRERHLGGKPPATMSERGAAFRRFQLAGGERLDRIGIFQALSDQFGPDDAWWEWPELYRDCESL